MRILMDYRPALRQRTGAGEYVHRLAEALVARLGPADRLTLFSSSWKDRLPPDAVRGADHVDARIPVRALNLAWHRLGWPPVEWLAGPIDISHAMHPLIIPSRRAAKFVTIHDLYFLDRPERTSREIRRDYPALAAEHARRADGVIVPSEYTRSLVQSRFGVEPSRITVCSPGAPAWPRRQEPERTGPIVFVGTVEPRKNIPGLFAAYATLLKEQADVPPLAVAGNVVSELEGVVRDARRRFGARLKMLGYVSDDQRLGLYSAASMVVMPSFDEGFGLPALEAMTLGVPVIAANRGALPEVAGDAAILVEPEDHPALAAAMLRVLRDAAERGRLAEAGVRRSRAYSWESAASRLYGAYERGHAGRQAA